MSWYHNGRKYWYHNGKRYSKCLSCIGLRRNTNSDYGYSRSAWYHGFRKYWYYKGRRYSKTTLRKGHWTTIN